MATYCFDIDGTLCTNTEGDYENAKPLLHAIAFLNALHESGHTIVLQTARGQKTKIDWRALTERQLEAWGIRYHALHFSKPSADVYIDDKAISAFQWHENGDDPMGILAGFTTSEDAT